MWYCYLFVLGQNILNFITSAQLNHDKFIVILISPASNTQNKHIKTAQVLKHPIKLLHYQLCKCILLLYCYYIFKSVYHDYRQQAFMGHTNHDTVT